jgi:lipopolysaccharide export system protein LptC
MAHFNNFHSRLVIRAKILLPLASLALLATLFLFARGSGNLDDLPFARSDIETLAREQRLDGPAFSTVTNDGAELEISAKKIRPDPSNKNVLNSTQVSAELKLLNSATITILANDAVIDGPSEIAELAGSVSIDTSTGYSLNTDRIAAQLNFTNIESPGPVKGEAPAGNISAGSMKISQDTDSGDYLLVFKEHVKLIYQP